MPPLIYQQARQRILRNRQRIEAVLGDGSGNVYTSKKSRYWVRIKQGTDSEGNVTYGNPLPMRYAGGDIPEIAGVDVLLFYDYDGELSIERVNPTYYDDADIDSRAFNPSAQHNQFLYLRNVVRGLTRPVGSSATVDSALVTIRELPFKVDEILDWFTYAGTPRAADKVDLTSYIPAADTHRLVCIFFDTFQQTYFVAASTAQAISSALDSTDYDECFAQLLHNEYIPLLSIELSDNNANITINNVVEDLRNFINMPRIYGFQNPIPSGKAILIRSTHHEIVYDLTVEGELTVEGDMLIL
jgi:hypothetical protein